MLINLFVVVYYRRTVLHHNTPTYYKRKQIMNASRKTFRYIFRYKIDPLYNAQDRIDELVQFCQKAQAEEVMMFMLAEELTTGHPTIEELTPYVEMLKTLKTKLAKHNIALSLNPWTTTYHTARGRKLKPGQNFTLMIREDGTDNGITACPLCTEWQKYICKIFSFLAKEVDPIAIWVEDDWRLHNHGPDGGWGGCFCELHLKRFAKRIGKENVTREEVLKKILAKGQPHPWRAEWINICRESLLEPAEKIRLAVQNANPKTRLALMSSSPDTHSIEGRDWHALQKALGDNPTFIIRPHMPPYTEETATRTIPAVTRHTIANLKGKLEIYPELENSPRVGQYSKSGTYNIWQCLNSAAFGSNGITINHFDMMGTGISLDPNISEFFANAKNRLNAIAELEIDDRQADGVRVLFSPNIARHIHSTNEKTMAGLTNQSDMWGKVFGILGIAYRFTDEIINDGEPYAVSDQTLRAFDNKQIEKLLSAPVMLDANSVEILMEKGFGELIGIKDIHWINLHERVFAYEAIEQSDKQIYGLAYPRMTAQRCSETVLAMSPYDNTRIISNIFNPQHEKLFPGGILFENKLGGKIYSITYPLLAKTQFFMAFFTVYRRKMLTRLLFENLAPNAKLAACYNHPAFCYRCETANGTFIAIINSLLDEAKEFILYVPKGQIDDKKLKILDSNGNWVSAKYEKTTENQTDIFIIKHSTKPLDGMFILG